MDRVADDLAVILQREVAAFHGAAYKASTYYLDNPNAKVYAVLIVTDDAYPLPDTPRAQIMVMARIQDDQIVIEEDITDKPLYDALVAAQISPERIVRRYLGEKAPTSG